MPNMSKTKELVLWGASFLFFLLSIALTLATIACLKFFIQLIEQWPVAQGPLTLNFTLWALLALIFFTLKAFGASKKRLEATKWMQDLNEQNTKSY